jgi:hypothetical protein
MGKSSYNAVHCHENYNDHQKLAIKLLLLMPDVNK